MWNANGLCSLLPLPFRWCLHIWLTDWLTDWLPICRTACLSVFLALTCCVLATIQLSVKRSTRHSARFIIVTHKNALHSIAVKHTYTQTPLIKPISIPIAITLIHCNYVNSSSSACLLFSLTLRLSISFSLFARLYVKWCVFTVVVGAMFASSAATARATAVTTTRYVYAIYTIHNLCSGSNTRLT